MQELKRLGVNLSIDDFGTGYSSLAYLRRIPLDELKIDAVFVKHMLVNRGDAQIVRSVIDLAHNFDLRAVAEGVEEPATFAMLASLGCDVIQGYHYAHPMPSVQVPAWWAKGGSVATSVDSRFGSRMTTRPGTGRVGPGTGSVAQAGPTRLVPATAGMRHCAVIINQL